MQITRNLQNVFKTGFVETRHIFQNNAARVILRRSQRHHVTSLLIQLHWLPVKYRIQYKLATLAFRKFDKSLPPYLSSLLEIKTNDGVSIRTRSSLGKKLIPPPAPRTSTYGSRAFSTQAPEIWNSLPSKLRDSPSLEGFKTGLKTHLFRIAFPNA